MATVDTTTLEKQQVLDENTLLKVVTSIDDLIDDRGLEILKLSMHSELTQTERDSAKSPSDLFHCLKKKYITPTLLYTRFTYTLEIVGHRFYGYRAIRKMEKVYTPPHFDVATQLHPTINVDEFILHQCLAIACRLVPENNWDNFIFHCAEKLNHNHNRYSTPCQVLTKMLQEGALTTENHEDVVEEALVKAGVSESVLHKYHKNCTKTIVSSANSRLYSRSRSSSCTVDSRYRTTIPLKRPTSQTITTDVDIFPETMRSRNNTFTGQTGHTTFTQQSKSRRVRSDFNVSYQTKVKAESLPLITVTETTPDQPLPTTEEEGKQTTSREQRDTCEVTNKQKGQKNKQLAYTCGCVSISLLGLLVCCLALLAAYGVHWDKIRQATIIKCYENSSVVLAEVNHFFTSSLSAMEDTKHIGDFYHDIEVYQLNSACNNLPTHKTISNINGTDLSWINRTALYALAGSSISLNICATTNHTLTELDRLDMVLYKDSQMTAVEFFHLGTDDEWQCKESTLLLDQQGYYTIAFLPPTHEASFTYTATFSMNQVDTKLLHRRALTNQTLHVNQDTFKVPLTFGATYSCLVATIKDNPHTLRQTVHIQLKFTKQTEVFVIGAVMGILFIIAVSVSMVISCLFSAKQTR